MLWECISYYVSWFGQWAGGMFASIIWIAAKVAENCV